MNDPANELWQKVLDSLTARGVGPSVIDKLLRPLQVIDAADGALLLRLRHVYQVGTDDPALAAPATVDVAALFAPRWVLAAVTELVVDASEPMAAARAKQIQWQQQPAAAAAAAAAAPATLHAPTRAAAAPFDVSLAPMEIKTLLLTLA